MLTLSVPSEMAEDGRWRGDVRPARQASRRPPPVLPRSKRNGSRSVLVSLVSDPQDTPSECPPSCAPSRGPDGTGAAGSCVEVIPPEPSLRRLSRIIRAFDRTHSRARAENAQVACPTPPDPAASDQHECTKGAEEAVGQHDDDTASTRDHRHRRRHDSERSDRLARYWTDLCHTLSLLHPRRRHCLGSALVTAQVDAGVAC